MAEGDWPVAEPGRRASLGDLLGFAVALAQAVGAGTLAVLSIRGTEGSGGSDASLVFTGFVFGVTGVVVAATAFGTLRGSVAARFGLIGAEAVLGVAGYLLIPNPGHFVGTLVAASAVIVVLLTTLFSRVGR